MLSQFNFDIIVIGAGHAGCEAASAAARMGARTCLITMDMEKIAQMSCNPAIGGIAKGQIVREIDALGGMTGVVTDLSAIQFRMLNRSKGPAMWSPRAQCDRHKYSANWRRILENTPNLTLWQDQVCRLLVEKSQIVGVETIWGATFAARCVVLTAGTFLNGLMHIGRKQVPGGRISEPAVANLTESIQAQGIQSGRMKTGTPVRIDARSVHFDELEEQPGEADYHRFSHWTTRRPLPQLHCWLCNTNSRVHDILRSGLDDSPLYNGQIQSIGPRYCPSIETKLQTFPDRDQHPLFLEPEGTDTNELYLNGFSSSLPIRVQLEALRQIPALRDAVVYRPGYAIEYDFFDPTQLRHSLESKLVDGLFMAGQVNGTTGYEEAAGQGLMAGINAALKLDGREPLVLKRDEAYIGVLIDDLVTKGVDEPYRMFTSRSEYRILLRQDNADTRLTPLALRHAPGLIDTRRQQMFGAKQQAIQRIAEACRTLPVKPKLVNPALEQLGSQPLVYGCKVADLLARPDVSMAWLEQNIPAFQTLLQSERLALDAVIKTCAPDGSDGGNSFFAEAMEAAEVELKYAGYISRERQLADKMRRLEDIRIRGRFNYAELNQLSTEARQKLARIDPETLSQASRIPGVSPSDIQVLLVLMHR